MKGSDKAVIFGVVMAVILGGFYLKVIGPKRDKASSLSKDVATLKSQISEQQQTAQYGEQARQEFPAYYSRLVVMGKAVPGQADTPSLLVELNAVAHRTGVDFRGITLSSSSATTSGSSASSSTSSTTSTTSTTPTTSTTSTTPAPSGSSSTSSSTSTPAVTSTSSTATETSAANLPLGATVGADNLAVMPYDLTFSGNYFQVADFLKGVDDLVHVRNGSQVAADGRLLTINGFSLSQPTSAGPNPKLDVSVSVTSYVAPESEGLTAGASPSGPAPSLTQPQTQPASATVTP